MKKPIKLLSDVIAEANDLFYEQNSDIDTVIGIMDKALRNQGMNADAISVDCIPLNKKIIFLIHDSNPTHVDIAFGNKAGDISSTRRLLLEEVNIKFVVESMINYLT